MKPESKKYLNKRRQIEDIISSIRTEYETDECFHAVYPDTSESRKAAEKILSKFGINKPQELNQH